MKLTFLFLCAVLPPLVPVSFGAGAGEPGFFGTGQAGLTAGGAGSFKITSPSTRAAVRFTAATGGPLESFSFGANPGRGYASRQADAFAVALHADNDGRPGRLIAKAAETIFNDGGARVRTARFAPGVTVVAGSVYHLVISAPRADADSRVFGVEYALLARGVTPVNSPDMRTVDPAGALQTSEGESAGWNVLAQAAPAHEVVIAGRPQGWGYTGTVEFQLKRGPAGSSYPMQTFAFDAVPLGVKVTPRRLSLSLRPQGALAGAAVTVFAEIVTRVGFETVASTSGTFTFPDQARFEAVAMEFEGGAALTGGADYVLIIGLMDEVTKDSRDFLFMRGFSWGIGSPNLHELSWQGTTGAAHMANDASGLGRATTGADLPFLIEF